MSLGIVPVVIIVMAIYALMLSFTTLALPLVGFDEMTETANGEVEAIHPYMMIDAEGNPRTGFSYDVRITNTKDTDANEDTTEVLPELLSVWCPEWYAQLDEGECVSLVYNPSAPSSCAMADMRDILLSTLSSATKVFGATLVLAVMALLVLLACEMA